MRKVCIVCQTEKEETAFRLCSNKHRPPKDGVIKEWRKNKCNECEKKRKVDKYYLNHESNKKKARINGKKRTREKRREAMLKEKFGVNEEWYKSILESQMGVCKICGGVNKNGTPLSVDHNHKSGETRGLLCLHCNSLLGFSRDNVTVLKKAIEYLKLYEPATESPEHKHLQVLPEDRTEKSQNKTI